MNEELIKELIKVLQKNLEKMSNELFLVRKELNDIKHKLKED